jgi:hypothetical protein
MGGIIKDAGMTVEEFKRLLGKSWKGGQEDNLNSAYRANGNAFRLVRVR